MDFPVPHPSTVPLGQETYCWQRETSVQKPLAGSALGNEHDALGEVESSPGVEPKCNFYLKKDMVRAKSFHPGEEKGDVQLEQRQRTRCRCGHEH